MAEHDRRADCQTEFNRLWDKLVDNDKAMNDLEKCGSTQAVQIGKLEVNTLNLISSMASLTKALWGITASIMLILIGFVIWYVQTKI